ncbi:cytokinin dehydrogenase 2-like [Rutidosis leptorrhynchoides]|uniref:cytokinin dehydrogenase 2-like n=1 Tax=Rutidosis leptorrhynchoides TaxID=125765 RepID=UPI003A994C6D
MAYNFLLFFLVFIITPVSSGRPLLNTSLPSLPFQFPETNNLCKDTYCIKTASTDYGRLVQEIPFGVLQPSSVSDIVKLVKSSYDSPIPFTIATRGNGHSVRGQAMAKDGVVIDMAALRTVNVINGIRVNGNSSSGFYADVGGEQLWIDVLQTSLLHGLAPVSWTDYLYLTVGGTLSNAGISGQTSFHGPQISNVLEMDVITGKGELVTCSKDINPDLFYAVLGGLGQFGIITRARIVLNKAPTRVKWFQIIYEDFSKFTKDQEHLISINGFDYVEGSLITKQSPAGNFFSPADASMINSLASNKGILYSLEAVKYYDDQSLNTIDEVLQTIFNELSFNSGFVFSKDAPIVDFLNRVRGEEVYLESLGLWDVPHPWLVLLVPKSRIMDFNQAVLVNIIQKQSLSAGPFIVYPFNRNKWDERMSVVIPEDEEDMFYVVNLLNSAGGTVDPAVIDKQNDDILQYCQQNGINVKEYLPHYTKKEEWIKHFGKKWNVFKQRKYQFDPKMILSPGHRIFNFE